MAQLAEDKWQGIKDQLLAVLNGSLRSSKPFIFGMPSGDAGEASTAPRVASLRDANALEVAAAEMAQAAAALVAMEREIVALAQVGVRECSGAGRGWRQQRA